jgi:site-specific DNA-methyltransferase (adenine-specific)
VRRAILASTQEGELVLDLFCGTGTTAAKELDRFFVGTDMAREFCELAGRRIEVTARRSMLREISRISAEEGRGSNNTRKS